MRRAFLLPVVIFLSGAALRAATGARRPLGLLLLFAASLLSAAPTNVVRRDPTELTLEELKKMEVLVPSVESTSKYKQRTTEAPASVTVVAAEEVKKYGYRTLADILRSVAGFHVSHNRQYAFLGARGINRGDYNTRVLLLVDGHRVNNGTTDAAFLGTEFILDVDLIDKVEISRGPGSALYGNNAFFAIINVVTRKGRELSGAGAELSGEIGSDNTYKGRVTWGHQFTNGLEMLLSGSWYDSEGQTDLFYPYYYNPPNTNGVAHRRDGDTFQSFFGSVSYEGFSLEGAYLTREKQLSTGPFFTLFNDPHSKVRDDRQYVNFKFAREFPEAVDVVAQVYYDRNGFRQFEPVFSVPANILYRETVLDEWWGTEVQLTRRIADRHTLIVGAEFRRDFRQRRGVVDAATGGGPPEHRRSTQNHGVYVEGNFCLLTNLHLNLGGRYDQYDRFEPGFNPRLALIYNPAPKSALKVIYGTAFRAPNFLELFLSDVTPLVPEKITSYELVYEQGLGEHFQSSLAAYYHEIDRLISVSQTTFTYANLGGAKAKGLEMGLEGFWTNGLRGRVSYTLQEATGERVSDAPSHLAKFNLSVPVCPQKLFASVEFQYTSRRATMLGQHVPGYAVVNATLFSRELVHNLELSASVYNLFDRRYHDPGTLFLPPDTIEQNGRSFRFKLTYRF